MDSLRSMRVKRLLVLLLGLFVFGSFGPGVAIASIPEDAEPACRIVLLDNIVEREPVNVIQFLVLFSDTYSFHRHMDFGDGVSVYIPIDEVSVRLTHTYWPSQTEGETTYYPAVSYETDQGAWYCVWGALTVKAGDPFTLDMPYVAR